MTARPTPSWTEHAVLWHVYPLGMCGAPIREADPEPGPHHRLRRLTAWLDYVVELGCNGLLLGPIFASETHGYDTTDQFRIDPRLGDEQDFDALVTACHDKGLRIVCDGVFSHVGAGHPWVRQALEQGPGSEYADLFDIQWKAAGGPRPRVFEGHDALVRLRHDSDAAVEYTEQVMRYWLDRGIDGWRLDAAYSVPAEFWARVIDPVRADHPDCWFLGEILHGDHAQLVADSHLDTSTQYELWKAIWSALAERNLFELEHALGRHNGFLDSVVPQTFVGNHDVTRIATAVGPHLATTAAAILLTVGGIPSIYHGDEQGFTGTKYERLGGDDEIRPAFPDSPDELATWGDQIHRAHQDLIGLRRRHPWLVAARTETVHLANEQIVYRSRGAGAGEEIEVSVDLAAAPTVRITGADGAVLWEQPGED